MKEVKIPKRLKPCFESKLNHAKEMVGNSILKHQERKEWKMIVKYWSRKLNKLNLQHKDT